MRSRIKVKAWEMRTSQQKTQEKAARATEHGPKRGRALTLRAFTQTPLCLKSILFQPAHAYPFKAQPMSNVLQEALLTPSPRPGARRGSQASQSPPSRGRSQVVERANL